MNKIQINKALQAILLMLLANTAFGQKEVALTIDDMPFVGIADTSALQNIEEKHFNETISVLKKNHIPSVGFVVPGYVEGNQWKLIKQYKQMGGVIANHTNSHLNFNRTGADQFISDIALADKRLQFLMKPPKYFRYPYLAHGGSCKKYIIVARYLKHNHYIVVPVTIDPKDYLINAKLIKLSPQQQAQQQSTIRSAYIETIKNSIDSAEKRTKRSTHRQVKQILLIHMNLLNALFMSDLITVFHQHGYRFVSVKTALSDHYYKTSDQISIQNRACNLTI